jgi:hypothetical protein
MSRRHGTESSDGKNPDPAFLFYADPDPTFQSDADPEPDPTFQFDADPNPTTHFFPDLGPPMLQNGPLRLQLFHFDPDFTLMRIRIHLST